ncbi:hypothetical protein BDV95DRAFT_224331 [Massariosphaeria phaeospora]|uniref:Uncharacterized protein n=1 Tax=Massariosphaeria phaeospora TaxID=100035 RepID=A0A7C8MGL1_9PLEO|nr:hypothetical protein BDV95DRAFT_224331 [Massariosphaeria phaeospora]
MKDAIRLMNAERTPDVAQSFDTAFGPSLGKARAVPFPCHAVDAGDMRHLDCFRRVLQCAPRDNASETEQGALRPMTPVWEGEFMLGRAWQAKGYLECALQPCTSSRSRCAARRSRAPSGIGLLGPSVRGGACVRRGRDVESLLQAPLAIVTARLLSATVQRTGGMTMTARVGSSPSRSARHRCAVHKGRQGSWEMWTPGSDGGRDVSSVVCSPKVDVDVPRLQPWRVETSLPR